MIKKRPSKGVALLQQQLLTWYDRQAHNWPWRQLWRHYRNPYHIWVSEVMLQQTVIKAALPAYDRFLHAFPSLDDLAASSVEQVKLVCQGLGYYRRFGLLHQAAKQLAHSQSTEPTRWPGSAQEWRQLPGVGPYTAAALASITLNEPVAVVDGNVERVICRLDDIQEPVNLPRLKPYYQQRAQQLLAVSRPGDFNQALMELGQRLCTPTQPKCQECPIASGCLALKRGTQHLAPGAKLKKATQQESLTLVLVANGDRIGIYRRSESDRFLKNTLGFFTIHKQTRSAVPPRTLKLLRAALRIGRFQHSITHHRIEVEVLLVQDVEHWPSPDSWMEVRALDKHLVANLDRKALRLALAKWDERSLPSRENAVRKVISTNANRHTI